MALKHDESSEPMSSAQWLDYFHDNALNLLELPWDAGAQITPPGPPGAGGAQIPAGEREAIAASVQEFQLGESSEGRNLISAARRYAEQSGDAAYLHGLLLFIAEEHRHARDLGRFLDLAGVP